MNTIIKDQDVGNWFGLRTEMYSKLLAYELTTEEKIKFSFSNPDAGWIDLSISSGNDIVETIQLTNVWDDDPIANIVRWLEKVHSEEHCTSAVYLEGEGRDILFQFDPFVYGNNELYDLFPNFNNMGLFSVIISEDVEKIHFAVCDRKKFVNNWYLAICDFAERQKNNTLLCFENWTNELYGKSLDRYSDNYRSNSVKMMCQKLQSEILDEACGRKKNKSQK